MKILFFRSDIRQESAELSFRHPRLRQYLFLAVDHRYLFAVGASTQQELRDVCQARYFRHPDKEIIVLDMEESFVVHDVMLLQYRAAHHDRGMVDGPAKEQSSANLLCSNRRTHDRRRVAESQSPSTAKPDFRMLLQKCHL